jgi:hypothetical protein
VDAPELDTTCGLRDWALNCPAASKANRKEGSYFMIDGDTSAVLFGEGGAIEHTGQLYFHVRHRVRAV